MADPDLKEIGLMVGLEVHQQLNTRAKLFCGCPTTIQGGEGHKLQRYLRPSMSELGEVDTAALFEWRRGTRFTYIAPEGCSCLVEADEEPPHGLNREALDVGIAVSMALGSSIVDEIYTMRKIVIDGSNTTGFQRTALVSLGGRIIDEEGEVGILSITIEEDAARRLEEDRTFSLDRLGVPLIEISTAPDIHTPEQAERVAKRIGQLLRLTGKAKRGLGSIRQDLNISIRGGTKVEVKGVQELELIPKVVRNEAIRQMGLLEIRRELERRGVSEEMINFQSKGVDLSEALRESSNKLISAQLRQGGVVMGMKAPKFGGLLGKELGPNRRLGTELADYIRSFVGLGGLFHSDELPKYGITAEEVERVRKILTAEEEDGFVILVGKREKVENGLELVKARLIQCLKGVPKETRGANDDGTTRFLRPQPGSARMYPETDVPPVRLSIVDMERARLLVPEEPEVKLKKLLKLGLNEELSRIMLNSIHLDLFEELVAKYHPKVPATLIATTMENTLKYIKSKGGDTSRITDEVIEEVMRAVFEDTVTKDSIPEILLEVAQSKLSVNEAIKKFSRLNEDEVTRIVRTAVEKLDNISDERRAFNIAMGNAMEVLRGKVDGKKVAEAVRREIEKRREKDKARG